MLFLKTRAIAAVVLCSFFINGCSNAVQEKAPSKFINDVVATSANICDSAGIQKAVNFIDSMCAGKDLPPEDLYVYYGQKYDLFHSYFPDHSVAITYADSLLQLIEKNRFLQDPAVRFKGYMRAANACYVADRYTEAFEYYRKAKEIASQSKSPCDEFFYLYRIAISYFRQENFIESARLFRLTFDKSLLCSKVDFELHFRQQEILSNTGLAYSKANMADSAVYFFREALRFISSKSALYPADSGKWEEATSVVYGNLGGQYKQLGFIDSSELYLKQSILLSERIGRNLKDRQLNVLKLADLYIDAGRKEDVRNLLDKYDSLDMAHRTHRSTEDNIEADFRRTDVYSRYCVLVGDFRKALDWVKKHDSLSEEKRGLTNKILKHDLKTGVEKISHERHILSLEKDVKIRTQQNIILVLAVILAAVVILVIYKYLKSHRKKYKRLERTNEQITKESAIKERQLQEKIRQDELNFMALIENTDDFLWSVDKEYKLMAFNKAYKEYYLALTGTLPETGKPEPLREFSAAHYGKLLEGYGAILSGATYEIVDKGITVNGRTPDIEVRFRPTKDEQGRTIGVSCFRRDITESVGLIRTLERNNTQLKDIAWVQSHKLRGPLTTIMSIISYLAEHEDEGEHRKDILKSLDEKVKEMDTIIHEIVDMTK